MFHHSRGLRELLSKQGVAQDESEALIKNLADDVAAAEVSDADRAMLDYAVVLTEQPASISEDHIKRLRSVGFDDLAIHDLASVVGYFAFVNRIADGLGVELEEE